MRKQMARVRQLDTRAGTDVLFVLGAGVDKCLGLPLLNTLFRDLSDFARGTGRALTPNSHPAMRDGRGYLFNVDVELNFQLY